MHSISFAFKRAHWRSVALGVEAVARVPDMTPARFDLLYVIRKGFPAEGLSDLEEGYASRRPAWQNFVSALQMTVRRILGVSRATVSRMVKRLVELGWVVCTPSRVDRRSNDIHLTTLGQRRIDDALRIVYRQRTHLSKFERIFAHRDDVLGEVQSFWWEVHCVASHLGDRSKLEYDTGWRIDWGIHEQNGYSDKELREDPLAYFRATFETQVRRAVTHAVEKARSLVAEIIEVPALDFRRPFGPTGDATPMPLP